MPSITESYLYPGHYDLVTPDGIITTYTRLSEKRAEAIVLIENISKAFVGYRIDPKLIFFNIKSSLAQLGINGTGTEYLIDPERNRAEVKVHLMAIGEIAIKMLALLEVGAAIGKLFAADEKRRVRDPDYLARMFGRVDRRGKPLLSLGGMQGGKDLVLEKVHGRTVAYLMLQEGSVSYEPTINGLLPTLGKALCSGLRTRELLHLHQTWNPEESRTLTEDKILLVRSRPLHIRTVFGRVVDNLLPKGFCHTTASVLQPDTSASGDIYELFGNSTSELNDIPIEFYTLEPHREHVFFADRDQLENCLDNVQSLFDAFNTAPKPSTHPASTFVVKGEQMLSLSEKDWITRAPKRLIWPGIAESDRQALVIQRYIDYQSSYPFLKAIDDGLITSQGVLLTRYFPSPFMKRMLLGDHIQRCLKGIYFQHPSYSTGEYFTQEDRSLLIDLVRFAVPVYWVDEKTGKILQYVQRPEQDSGMFVPLNQVETFLKATMFGIYGSNLLGGQFEEELTRLLEGVLRMKEEVTHPLLNHGTPLVLVTGGGPGAMEVGNRVAKTLKILSCAYIIDFQPKDGSVVNEQKQNPHIEGKMPYCLTRIVERQAEFHLDLPIFLRGGIGTDFELSLEELLRKVGGASPTPVILFGEPSYWRTKITSRFQNNLSSGTIQGSEWISNCFYCTQNATEALFVYRQFFEGKLAIGKNGPTYKEGFVEVAKLMTENPHAHQKD